jgi:signal transduction histidine kinase/ActR/RegA family two-component response regulator
MRQQAAIARLGARALASRDTRALLDECVAEIARTLDAELVKVLELTPDGSQLLLRTGIGWNLGLVGKERVPSGTNSQAGFTLSSKVPVLVDDLPSERRFAGPDLLTSHGVRSGVSVVIRSDEGAFGILAAHSRKPSFFHGEDALFLQTAANLLGEALSRERLEARLARQGRLEALGRLAGGVAHDFNNLLTVILAYADALSENSASVDAPSAAKEIRNAAERAAALTRELLAFSRREPGTPTTLDLNEVVPRILRMLRRLVGEDVQLRTSWSPEPCPVLADASQIERVLMNLVVNARDAQPGGGEIAIETRREVRAGRPLVKLVVSDRGPGMPAHVLAHAFEPFFTTKTNGTGSGLGLATVYGLVSQLGGQVLMSSEVGAGTRIEVELPMAAETPVASSASPPNDVAMDTRGSGETILLAEDDDELRGLLRSALEQSGYVVWQAHDGRAALAIVESQPGAIDALVTDVVMPGASGLDVVARLRELSPGAGVLYTSGFLGDEGDLSELQREDVVFLRKPFRTSELEAALRKALARRVAPTAAAAKMLAPHAV